MSRALLLTVALGATACVPGDDGVRTSYPLVTTGRSNAGLAAEFADPPSSAGPLTWWHWMNGNISRPGITADLEAMKAVGLKGAVVFSVAQDTPAGEVTFGSEEYFELAAFASSEAERLGLELGFHNCDGWSASGGPWITPELSMKTLTASFTRIHGPGAVSELLAEPTSRLGLYEDIAVLALPAKRGRRPARIPELDKRASFHPFASRRPMPQIASRYFTDPDEVLDLTEHLDDSGRLVWQVPAGDWTVLRLGYTTTGRRNRVASEAGSGLECDKLDPEAVEFHFDQYLGKILSVARRRGSAPFRISAIDSFEVGAQNWTDGLIEDFAERNGYDITPYLPALFGLYIGSSDVMEKVYYDWRRTIARLMEESYFRRFAELSEDNGLLFYLEPYGTGIFNDLDVARHASRPTGEFWVDRRWHLVPAVSGGHIYGKKVISAEAFTQGHENQEIDGWQAHPALLKPIGDEAWSAGVNEFLFHRFVHQPNIHARPGLGMGRWGMHMDRTQTWWSSAGKAWVDYLRRGQLLLREGAVAADLLVFVGDRVPAHLLAPEVPPRSFDMVNSDVLLSRAAVEGGRIVLPDGASYRMLVLSDWAPEMPRTMLPQTLRRIHELVEAGATLYGPPPTDSPSLAPGREWTEECDAMVEDLWGPIVSGRAEVNRFGEGRVVWGMGLERALDRFEIEPALRSDSGDLGWAWIHRSEPARDIFFLANTGEREETHMLSFAVAGGAPQLWYAESGSTEPVAIWDERDGRIRLPLTLAPSASVFVLFDRTVRPPGRVTRARSRSPWRSLANTLATSRAEIARVSLEPEGTTVSFWSGGDLGLTDAEGRDHTVRFDALPEPVALEGPWSVAFDPALGGPESLELDRLMDWTNHPDEGVRYYSGTATYTMRFELDRTPAEGERLVLDLGEVRDVAEVSLNGAAFATLWKPPFVLDVTETARAGDNQLAVRVTNTWVNRLIGDERLYPNRYGQGVDPAAGTPLTDFPGWFRRGEPPPTGGPVTFTSPRFHAAEDRLHPAGLLGPVRLRSVAVRRLAPPSPQ